MIVRRSIRLLLRRRGSNAFGRIYISDYRRNKRRSSTKIDDINRGANKNNSNEYNEPTATLGVGVGATNQYRGVGEILIDHVNVDSSALWTGHVAGQVTQ